MIDDLLNKKAPLFTLKNQHGEKVALKDFIGKRVLLYFYPKAMTPGCTCQAQGIRDYQKEWAKRDVVVLAISPDSPERLQKFVEKESLNFLLLSDEDHAVAEKYFSYGKKKLYGKEYMGFLRQSFIIGEDGKIKKILPKVNTKTHHEDLLKIFDQIGKIAE